MKSMSVFARGFLLVAISLLGVLGGCESNPAYMTYLSAITGTTESVLVPDHAVISTAELTGDVAEVSPSASPTPEPVESSSPTSTPSPTSIPSPISTLAITMAASRPADLADPLVVVSYLRNAAGEDRAIILGVRTVAPISTWLPEGHAAIVDPATRSILELRPLAVVGASLSASFSPELLTGYAMRYTGSFWLPAALAPETVTGGLFSVPASVTRYGLYDSMAQVMLPDVDCSTYVTTPLPMPRSANAACPPRPGDNVTDVDLDGRTNTTNDREVIYNDSITDMGNGKIFVILGFIRPNAAGIADGSSSAFVPVIVDDDDGDKKPDPEEIKDKTTTKAIGQCVYPRGVNSSGRRGNIITWTCKDYDASGKPTGRETRYEYNLDTGELKTFKTEPGGTERQVPNSPFPI